MNNSLFTSSLLTVNEKERITMKKTNIGISDEETYVNGHTVNDNKALDYDGTPEIRVEHY